MCVAVLKRGGRGVRSSVVQCVLQRVAVCCGTKEREERSSQQCGAVCCIVVQYQREQGEEFAAAVPRGDPSLQE